MTETRPRYVLTPRQKQVLDEIARDGADNPTIARRLGISHETMKSHVRQIMTKTPYSTRTGLVLGWVKGEFVVRVRDSNAEKKK